MINYFIPGDKMRKIDVNLWINYHKYPHRHYSEAQMREIRASEFAMHLLVPTSAFNNRINIEEVKRLSFMEKYQLILRESEFFGVPPEVISIKIDELIKESEKEEVIEPPKENKIKGLIKRIIRK